MPYAPPSLTGDPPFQLNFRRRLLLLTVAWTSVISPTLIASVNAATPAAKASDKHAQTVKLLAFDVVSIRPSKPGGLPDAKVLPDGYSAKNQNLWTLIMTAYFPQGFQYWSNDRLLGAPPWAVNDSYDVQAKVSPADVAEWQKQGPQHEMLRAMVQTLLVERCKLVLHHTTSDTPIYALVVGKHGSKLHEARFGEPHPTGVPLPGGGILIPGGGELKFFETPLSSLAAFLSRSSPRPVTDETDLKGKYDFVLLRRDGGNESLTDPDPPSGYMLGDVGLALKSAKAPLDTLVIDHIEKPSAN